jgi:spermidine synthase
MLVLDGIPQSAALDEYIYHETLVHSAMAIPNHPRSVLIAGGGEGACLREVLRHESVERVVMIEVDELVVDLCRLHLPEMSAGGFEDPRVQLIYTNARDYLESTKDLFDCVILDLSDPLPNGPSSRMFTREAFECVADHMASGGALSIQAEPAALGLHAAHCTILRTLQSVFVSVIPIYEFMPLYGTLYGFAVAANDSVDKDGLIECSRHVKVANGKQDLRHWDVDACAGAVTIPRYVRDRLEADSHISTDAKPIEVSGEDLHIVI